MSRGSWVLSDRDREAELSLSMVHTSVRSEGKSEKTEIVSDFVSRHLNISDA